MDYNQFREILERTCRHIVEDCRMRQGPGEKEIALAKLDGLFLGCLACAKTLGENPYEGGLMDVVRELTEKYQSII